MSSKEELYKVLLEISPYGTLFFVYGVCIECNDKAMALLGCERSHLIGASLDEISGDESSALIDLKLRLKRAVNNSQKRLQWHCPQDSGESVDIDVCIEPVPHNPREFVVTMIEARENALPQPVADGSVQEAADAAVSDRTVPESVVTENASEHSQPLPNSRQYSQHKLPPKRNWAWPWPLPSRWCKPTINPYCQNRCQNKCKSRQWKLGCLLPIQ